MSARQGVTHRPAARGTFRGQEEVHQKEEVCESLGRVVAIVIETQDLNRRPILARVEEVSIEDLLVAFVFQVIEEEDGETNDIEEEDQIGEEEDEEEEDCPPQRVVEEEVRIAEEVTVKEEDLLAEEECSEVICCKEVQT